MERLVIRIGNEHAVPTEFDMDFAFDLDKCMFDGLQRIFDQLCDLTDILGDEYDLGKLMELVQAKRKGRCIVLPCKKGDTVWRIVHDAAPHITKDRCTDIKYENRDIWVHLIGDRVMGGWNFGKLLFLTREDAEAALRREQE